MKRRDFLRLGAASAAGLALADSDLAWAVPASAMRLTLLHTNDVHSHMEPMETGEFAGMGGAAVRATLVKRLRAKHPNVLLLDAGDLIQGTAYFNLFNGEPEIKAMNEMGYDASAIGNHDFDAGIERLAELAKMSKFPFLCANYDFSDTPMTGLMRESMVIEREGLRIGLLGLGIKLDGLVSKRVSGETQYRDPISAARRVAQQLRHDEKCDFVACLSHINIRKAKDPDDEPGDRDLIEAVPEIDVVLGGHNHILLDEPEEFERATGKGWVNQTGWAGTHVGILQFDVYGPRKVELTAAGPIAAHASSFHRA